MQIQFTELEEKFKGKTELIEQYLNMFAKEMPGLLKTLGRFIEHQHWDSATAESNQINILCKDLGLYDFANVSLEISKIMTERSNLSILPSLFSALEAELMEFILQNFKSRL